MASSNGSVLNGNSEKSDGKCSKDLLRNEIITREDHIRSLVQSKGPPKTFQVKSSALAQAKLFLPKFAEAEKARLTSGAADEVNIETEDSEATGPLIEMNFALAGPVSSSDDSSSDSESSEASSESEGDRPALKVRRPKRTGTTNGSALILEVSQKDEELHQKPQ
ncbi:uncharacterized protein LOC144153686 [Haemaphysalis longicornis]